MFREAALTALNDNVDYTCLYNSLPLIFFCGLYIIVYELGTISVPNLGQMLSIFF